jgi:ABC-type branched-subunit amino acid transport system permease subunit
VNGKEKYLYHQIHPFKLSVDICAGFGSLYPLWEHHLALALIVMLVPPPIASFVVMRYANLEPYQRSTFGRYVARNMTHAMEALRLAGIAILAVGAWYHSIAAMIAGIALVLFAWLRGKIIPRQRDQATGC